MNQTYTHKIAGMALSQEEVQAEYEKGYTYIAKYNKIYQVNYSQNIGFYTDLLYTQPEEERRNLPLTRSGRFMFVDESMASYLSNGYIVDHHATREGLK